MALSKFQKQMMSLTPEQRKKAVSAVSDMMGMPPLKKKTAKKTTKAKSLDLLNDFIVNTN